MSISEPATPASAPTVLYVEDDPANQNLMRGVFRKRPGVKLSLARLGSEAQAMALAERPTLILLDQNLPDMTGDEFLHLLRARDETAQIPVVIVSGDTGRPRKADAEQLVVGVLTKPYRIDHLLALLDRYVAPPAI